MTKYPTLADALYFHAVLLARYGGADGLRDLGALESALYRPQTGYYSDLMEEAAALWESLSQNHPFLDGNKRTAFAVVDSFLECNGVQLNAEPDQAYAFMMNLYETGRFEFAELVVWLREHCVTVP